MPSYWRTNSVTEEPSKNCSAVSMLGPADRLCLIRRNDILLVGRGDLDVCISARRQEKKGEEREAESSERSQYESGGAHCLRGCSLECAFCSMPGKTCHLSYSQRRDEAGRASASAAWKRRSAHDKKRWGSACTPAEDTRCELQTYLLNRPLHRLCDEHQWAKITNK